MAGRWELLKQVRKTNGDEAPDGYTAPVHKPDNYLIPIITAVCLFSVLDYAARPLFNSTHASLILWLIGVAGLLWFVIKVRDRLRTKIGYFFFALVCYALVATIISFVGDAIFGAGF